jgi:choline kinase
MKAIMLAAGVGARLGQESADRPPKILLRFDGKSLLEHHLEIFRNQGISELVIGVGYKNQDIESEIIALGAGNFVRTVLNKDYREGNIVTLWTLRDELRCGTPIVLLDADILYEKRLIERLIKSTHQNCLLLDRNFEPGDEPVKICVRDNEIVEFRKWLSTSFDFRGESVGMFKLSFDIACQIIEQTELYLDQGRRDEAYEEAIRDVILTSPRGTFAFEDITGLAWIEIDTPADVRHARLNIIPSILSTGNQRVVMPRNTLESDNSEAQDL